MASFTGGSQINTFAKGMQLDADPSAVQYGVYTYAENMRIADAGTSGSISNIGRIVSTGVDMAGEVLGSVNCGSYSVIITKISPSALDDSDPYLSEIKSIVERGVPGEKIDDILLVYKHSIIGDEDKINLISILYDGSKSHANRPISKITYVSMLSSIEGPQIHRIYIADKVHPLYTIDSYRDSDNDIRVIDILKAESGSGSFTSPKIKATISDGSLRAGRYFYIVKYLSESGAESRPVASTNPIDITISDSDGGIIHSEDGKADVTNKGVRIDLSDIDSSANAVSIYRVYAKSSIQNPEIHLIYSEPTDKSGSVSILDSGLSPLSDVSTSESVSFSEKSPIIGSIDSKDNMLVAGNIKYRKPASMDDYDTRALSFDINGRLEYRNSGDPVGTSSRSIEYNSGISSIDSDKNYLKNLGVDGDDFICDEIYTRDRYRDVKHRYAPTSKTASGIDPFFGGVGVNVRYEFIHSYLIAAAGGELTKAHSSEHRYFRDDLIGRTSQFEGHGLRSMAAYDAACMMMSRDNLVLRYGDEDRDIDHITIRSQDGSLKKIDTEEFGVSHHRGKLDYSNGLLAGTMAGFKRNEVYRFAAKFTMSDGSETAPKWIADIRFPSNYMKYHSRTMERGADMGVKFSFNSFCAPEDFNEDIYSHYSVSENDEDYFKSSKRFETIDELRSRVASGMPVDSNGFYEFNQELLVKPLGLKFTFNNLPDKVKKISVMYTPMDYLDRSIVGQFFVNRIGTFSTGGMTAEMCNKMNYFEGASCDGYSYPQPIPSMKYSSGFTQMIPLYSSGLRGITPLGTQFNPVAIEAKDGVVGNGMFTNGDGFSSNGGCGILGFDVYASLNASLRYDDVSDSSVALIPGHPAHPSRKMRPELYRSSTAVSTSPYFSDYSNYMLCNPESSYFGDSYSSIASKLGSSIVFENIIYAKQTLPWISKSNSVDKSSPGNLNAINIDRIIPTIGKYLPNGGISPQHWDPDLAEYHNLMFGDDYAENDFHHDQTVRGLFLNGWGMGSKISESGLSRASLTAQSGLIGFMGSSEDFHDVLSATKVLNVDGNPFTSISASRGIVSAYGLKKMLPSPTYLLCASYLTYPQSSIIDDSTTVTQCAVGSISSAVIQAAESNPLSNCGMIFPIWGEDGQRSGFGVIKCLYSYFSSNRHSLSTPHVGHCEAVELISGGTDMTGADAHDLASGSVYGNYSSPNDDEFSKSAVAAILGMAKYEKTFSVFDRHGSSCFSQSGEPIGPRELFKPWDVYLGLITLPVSIKTFMSGQGYSPSMVRSNSKSYSNKQNGEDNGGNDLSRQIIFYGWDNGIDNPSRRKEITIGESTILSSPEHPTLTGNHSPLASYKVTSAMKYYKSFNTEPRHFSNAGTSENIYDERAEGAYHSASMSPGAKRWFRYGTYYRYASLMFQTGYTINSLSTHIGIPMARTEAYSCDTFYSPSIDFGGKYNSSRLFRIRYNDPSSMYNAGMASGPWDIPSVKIDNISYSEVIRGPYQPMSGGKSIPTKWSSGFINYSKSLRHDIVWDRGRRRPDSGDNSVYMTIACETSPSHTQQAAINNRDFNHSSFKSIRIRKSGGISGKHGAGLLVSTRSTIPMIGHISVSDAQQKYLNRFACYEYTNPGDNLYSSDISIQAPAKRKVGLVNDLNGYMETLYGASAAHTATHIVDMRAARHPLSSRLSKLDKANSKYIDCAFTYSRSGDKAEMYVFGGDTYVGLFDYTSTYADTPAPDDRLAGKGPSDGDAWNQTALLCQSNRINIVIPMESYMNVHVDGGISATLDNSPWLQNRADDAKLNPVGSGFAETPHVISQDKDEYAYIDGFSYKKKFSQIEEDTSSDERFNSYEHSSRVILSEPKTYGEQVDSWTKFKPANYMDIDSSNGEINSIKTHKDRTYAFQDRAVTFLSINERSLISDGAAGTAQLLLGSAKGFGGHRVVSNSYGLSVGDERAIYNGPGSIYFFDRLRGAICSVNQVVKDMSLVNGVRRFSESILPKTITTIHPTNQSNFIIGPFGDGDEVMFSSRANNGAYKLPYKSSWNNTRSSILYSEPADGFESFLTDADGEGYDISHSFDTDRQVRIIVRDPSGVKPMMMKESKSDFSNAILGFVSNNNYPVTKVFDSTDINISAYHKKTHPYSSPGVEISAMFFNSATSTTSIKLAFGSKDQQGTINKDMRYSENRNADVHTAIPRSGRDGLSRMRDKYLVSMYSFISNKHRISIPYIKTNYRESRR